MISLIRSHLVSVVLLALALAAPAGGTVPGEVDYQGLLLDDQGQPVNGNADFVFSLYDAPSGGSLLWTESHPGVPVLDGVYDVELGSSTPLTPGLVAGGALHLEIEVDGETLTPRQRLVAVPYALRADTAENAENVGTAPRAFVTQIYENFAFDGADPPNDDPSEGTADTDGDGLVNFLDPDNDDDGIPDGDEVAAGSDVNLATPTITALDPPAMAADANATVTVLGSSFEPGMSVVFGSEAPAPQGLTPTSFDVVVGPQTVGTADVQVTRANGESASATFEFQDLVPTLSSLDPFHASAVETSVVTVNGSGFGPGLEVAFGSENPVPQNVTPTSFQVSVGPQATGVVTVTVSYAGGPADTANFYFSPANDTTPRIAFATSTSFQGDLGGLAGADATCQALAEAASLPGLYLAWLSDGDESPASRFLTGSFGYERTDGVKIADDFADLADGSLDAPLDRTESGSQLAALSWTSVGAGGVAGSPHCNGWTSSASGVFGRVGDTTQITEGTTKTCDHFRRLFCFQQF